MKKAVLVHYTRRAEADLEAIAAYTSRTWGNEQCAFYLNLLQEVCETFLNAYPNLSRPVTGYDELLTWRVEHHVVYFKYVADGIEVVRILHERQLPARHLKR